MNFDGRFLTRLGRFTVAGFASDDGAFWDTTTLSVIFNFEEAGLPLFDGGYQDMLLLLLQLHIWPFQYLDHFTISNKYLSTCTTVSIRGNIINMSYLFRSYAFHAGVSTHSPANRRLPAIHYLPSRDIRSVPVYIGGTAHHIRLFQGPFLFRYCSHWRACPMTSMFPIVTIVYACGQEYRFRTLSLKWTT